MLNLQHRRYMIHCAKVQFITQEKWGKDDLMFDQKYVKIFKKSLNVEM